MQIDLNKTLLHDTAKESGTHALHLTLTGTPTPQLAEQIGKDMTTMLTQAVNTLLAAPGKPAATAPLSSFVGYLEELARVTGALAEGYAFRSVEALPGVGMPTLEIMPAKVSGTTLAPTGDRAIITKKGIYL